MKCSETVIRPELPGDLASISHLHDEAFGPGRFAKTAYRVREGVRPVEDLSLVALLQGHLVGSIRFTAIRVGDREGALLLGPLAVYKEFAGHGCGRRLMEQGLELARARGFRVVLLVGDLAYYSRVGFFQVPLGQMQMPGPVDYTRLLAVELVEGALDDYRGMIRV